MQLNRKTYPKMTDYTRLNKGTRLELPWFRDESQTNQSARELAEIMHGHSSLHEEGDGPMLDIESEIDKRIREQEEKAKEWEAVGGDRTLGQKFHDWTDMVREKYLKKMHHFILVKYIKLYALLNRMDAREMLENSGYQDVLRFLEFTDFESVYTIGAFTKADIAKIKCIDVAEFLSQVGVERSGFAKTIFSSFDADGSGEIDFKEWAFAVWDFNTMDFEQLLHFTFGLYSSQEVSTSAPASVFAGVWVCSRV